jgi:hypothetical protein
MSRTSSSLNKTKSDVKLCRFVTLSGTRIVQRYQIENSCSARSALRAFCLERCCEPGTGASPCARSFLFTNFKRNKWNKRNNAYRSMTYRVPLRFHLCRLWMRKVRLRAAVRGALNSRYASLPICGTERGLFSLTMRSRFLDRRQDHTRTGSLGPLNLILRGYALSRVGDPVKKKRSTTLISI